MIRSWLRREPEERPVLGRLVRDAWTGGPEAPSVDAMLAALRPSLASVDAEAERAPGLAVRVRRWLEPPLLGAVAAAGAAVVVLAFLLAPRPVADSGYVTAELTPTGDPTVVEAATALTVPDVSEPEASLAEAQVVDVQSNDPVLLFESEESTLIWIVEGQDDLSRDWRGGTA